MNKWLSAGFTSITAAIVCISVYAYGRTFLNEEYLRAASESMQIFLVFIVEPTLMFFSIFSGLAVLFGGAEVIDRFLKIGEQRANTSIAP